MYERYYYGRLQPERGTSTASAGVATATGAAHAATFELPAVGYIESVLTLSPYVFWPLQEASGNPVEQVGSGPTLIQYGGITYQAAGPTINGEAFYGMTTGTDVLYGSGTGYLNGSTSGFTISGWSKTATSASYHNIMQSYTSAQGTWNVRKDSSNGFQGRTFQSTNAAHGDATAAAAWPNNTWVWWALRYDTAGTPTLRVYCDTATADDTSFTGTWKRDGTPYTTIGTAGVTASHAMIAFWTTPLADADMTKLRTGVF